MKQLTDERIEELEANAFARIPEKYWEPLYEFAHSVIAKFCKINGITAEAQPAREWVGLTGDELLSAAKNSGLSWHVGRDVLEHFARAIESKLREKNAGLPAADDKAGGEPVMHQYQGKDGAWHNFINQKHYEDTLADGRWPIRALYTRPQPQAEAVRVPEGYALVPVEPTDDMLRAIRNQRSGGRIGKGDRADWAAWLAAAPKPQEGGAA